MAKKKHFNRTYSPKKLSTILTFVGTGILCGIVIGSFKTLIKFYSSLMLDLFARAKGNISYSVLIIALFFIIGSFIYYLSKKDPNINGSGIPVIYAMLNDKLKVDSFRTLIRKFIASILTIGSGLTLGREGPSVQIGGLLGDIAHKMTKSEEDKSYFIGASAGAGLAVAFNAPMAGVLFTIEEIFKKTDRKVFLSTAITIFSAVITSDLIFGNLPALVNVPKFQVMHLKMIIHLVILGLITGLSGVFFNKIVIGSKGFFGKININPFVKYMIPFIVTGLVLLVDINLFSSGESYIFFPIKGNPNLGRLIFLYFAKILLLALAFGVSIPGGSLVPLLVIGSLVGNIFASFLANIGLIDPQLILIFSMMAMCGHFSAIVRTPITAIILVLEMTGGAFNYLLGLSVVSLVSYSTAEIFKSKPFYDHLYEILIKK